MLGSEFLCCFLLQGIEWSKIGFVWSLATMQGSAKVIHVLLPALEVEMGIQILLSVEPFQMHPNNV